MVVLLAIAGSVAAVLLSRAASTTDQLNEVDTIYERADSKTQCDIIGGHWEDAGDGGTANDETCYEDPAP